MELTWEEWKAMKKDLRRRFSGTGWTLLAYFIIMNAAVILWMFVEVFWNMLHLMLEQGPGGLIPQYFGSESGWGFPGCRSGTADSAVMEETVLFS